MKMLSRLSTLRLSGWRSWNDNNKTTTRRAERLRRRRCRCRHHRRERRVLYGLARLLSGTFNLRHSRVHLFWSMHETRPASARPERDLPIQTLAALHFLPSLLLWFLVAYLNPDSAKQFKILFGGNRMHSLPTLSLCMPLSVPINNKFYVHLNTFWSPFPGSFARPLSPYANVCFPTLVARVISFPIWFKAAH